MTALLHHLKKTSVLPDIARLPDDALLSRAQIAALSGFSIPALKKWARQGRGPKITVVEGSPRTKVRDFRLWVDGASRKVAS